MDKISPAARSLVMRAVGRENTGPELRVRRMLHALGYRYRLHKKTLPGSPDIVFSKRKKVLFVHGCFWHGHGCRKSLTPKSRQDYWLSKIERNRTRDAAVVKALADLGWSTKIIWECETRDTDVLQGSLEDFLDPLNAWSIN